MDAIVLMPEGVGDGGKNVVVGVGDGTIRIVKLGPNKLVGEPLRHDEVESVVGLGFDVEGRLISGGGSIVKVWQEKMSLEDDSESEDDDGREKRQADDSDDSDAADSSDSDQKPQKKRRKTKTNKNAGNGIIGFKGLE